MLTSQRLSLRSSEVRQRLNELANLDKLSEEDRSECDTLTAELSDIETRYRAALLAEDRSDEAPDPDRVELRSNVKVGDYLAALKGRQNLAGAAGELNAELKLAGNHIPFEALETRSAEDRADMASGAPATVGVNLRPIAPFVFAASVAPMLGIEMPTVGRGTYAAPHITSALEAESKGKGQAVESAAAVFGVKSMTPKRVSARLTWQLEDEVSFGAPDFESALRANLQMALSDQLDTFLLNDNSGTHDPEGLIGQLGSVAGASNIVTYTSAIATFADLIDGLWSRSLSDIRAIVNADVIKKLEALLQVPLTSGANGEKAVAQYLREAMGGLVSHHRMPAHSSNVSTGVAFRAGNGLMERPAPALCASWGSVEVTDIYSDSAAATTHATVHTLVSDVQVLYPAAYSLFSIKTA